MLTSASLTMIVSNAVFMAASFASVALRLLARKQKMLSWEADDLLNIAAWVFSALLAVTNIVGVPVGSFGVPFESLSDEQSQNFLKVLFILQFWYIIAVALVKLSVLCFYGRIFQLGSWPTSIRIFLVLVIGWLIAFLFATFFQIWPLWCNWIACAPTSNYALMYTLCSATDIVLDIAILAIPVSFVRHLQMSANQKFGVTAIFGLGIFCVVSSCARLAYTVQFLEVNIAGDYASNFDTAVVNIIMWSGIEANASVICANLPTYRPLLGKTRHLRLFSITIPSLRSLLGSRSKPSARMSPTSSKSIIHGVPMVDSRASYSLSSTPQSKSLPERPSRDVRLSDTHSAPWEMGSKAESATYAQF